jgi:superfamily II DNA/RNA helicase
MAGRGCGMVLHRRMASSIPALAASLENVAARLRRLQAGQQSDEAVADLFRDLEDEAEIQPVEEEPPQPIQPATLAGELVRVESFVARARSLPDDAKAQRFQEAIKVILDLGQNGRGSGKAVVFTESITTQDYLRSLLLTTGLRDDEITLFRGVNDSERAQQAYELWKEEEGTRLSSGAAPSREVAVRLALVHEFRTRSKVFVCTEAGAKGLNLQFCETVINYDLPWNPQRIEQRIGRCHRYGQKRDVTVINFTARDNEAQRLTFDILSQKLDLFGKVLDASDTVLHEPRTDNPEILVSALKSLWMQGRANCHLNQSRR